MEPLIKGFGTGKLITSTEPFSLGMHEWVSEMEGIRNLKKVGGNRSKEWGEKNRNLKWEKLNVYVEL